MGSGVKISNKKTYVKSRVNWFIPKSFPESQSNGKADKIN